MSFAIRQATGADLSAAVRLEALAGHGRWGEAAFAAELGAPRSRFWVATAPDGEVIGFCVGWLVADEAQLQNIAIRPDWQRRGVARALVAALISEARASGATRLELEVRDRNLAARRLYESLGFATVGRRRRYYSDTGEDAVLMSLAL